MTESKRTGRKTCSGVAPLRAIGSPRLHLLWIGLIVVGAGCSAENPAADGNDADASVRDGGTATGVDDAGVPDDGGNLADGGRTKEPRCGDEPLRSTGSVYYVCDCQSGAAPGCQPGSDANAGTDPSAPWKTLGKTFIAGVIADVNDKGLSTFLTMKAGSTVALCRGGSWANVVGMYEYGSGAVRNLQCEARTWSPLAANADPSLGASNPAAGTCDLRDYSPPWAKGAEPKPKIQLAHVGDAFNDFSRAGVNNFAHLGWHRDYVQKPQAGLRFFNLEIVGPDPAKDYEVGFQFSGSTTDVEMCNLDVHNGVAAAGFVTASTLQRIALRNSRIYDNYGTSSIGVVSARRALRRASSAWVRNCPSRAASSKD